MHLKTMCAVSLANNFRIVADAFRPLRTHQRYWTPEMRTSPKASLSNREHTACGETRKMYIKHNQNPQKHFVFICGESSAHPYCEEQSFWKLFNSCSLFCCFVHFACVLMFIFFLRWFANDIALFLLIHITFVVKEMLIYMGRNRVSKSCLIAKLCFYRFVHFSYVPIFLFWVSP